MNKMEKQELWGCYAERKHQMQGDTQTERQTGTKLAISTDRQKHRQWDSRTFRINTGALSVAQEEILLFDVKPCDLGAVWGIEAPSKQTSTPLTPSRSMCVCLSKFWHVHMCTYVQKRMQTDILQTFSFITWPFFFKANVFFSIMHPA